MVTFICEYCDTTLKKKQCEGHIRGSCRPGALICIDCGSTFRGSDYKNHITCISEQQKHWGDYAKVKKTKMIAKQEKPAPVKKQKVSVNAAIEEIMIEQKNDKVQEPIGNEWKGWKNELKAIIKSKEGKIQKNELMAQARNLYQQKVGEKQISDDLIAEKISKLKKAQQVTYIILK